MSTSGISFGLNKIIDNFQTDEKLKKNTFIIGLVACAAIGARLIHSRWKLASSITEISNYTLSALDKQKIDDLHVNFLKEGSTHSALVTALKEMKKKHPEFFLFYSQEKAKQVFTYAYGKFFNLSVEFPKPNLSKADQNTNQSIPDIFSIVNTKGVQYDILNSAKDLNHLHVYQVASQYNASEAIDPSTPEIGHAMKASAGDYTQGPLAQRTNPIAFELALAFLTHLGFNMLENAIPSAGKTYNKTSSIAHGYLIPNNENLSTLTKELETNLSEAEYVCYESQVTAEGKPVHIFLQAAPAIGYAKNLSIRSDSLQRHAALANYSALFQYGINLAKKSGQAIILHANAPGSGVFQNSTKNLQWGFHQAALMHGDEMKRHNVSVQLEAFLGKGPMEEIGRNLSIPHA